jgi:hypothetical protein
MIKALIQRERIRISPVPTEKGYVLWVWLKRPLKEGNKPFVYADVEPNKKFYDLPCSIENINWVTVKPK